MPILAENFRANALSGTVLVTDGYANLALVTNPYALEGNKSFIIKIRKGAIDGQVVATSPTITLLDNSEFVSLTANVSTVAEGNLVSFTLITANAADNANLYYSILPITANVNAQDFVGANVGKATIINNQAVFSYFANADYSIVDETGETFKVQLRTNSPTGNIVYTTSNVAITDFYKTVNVFRFEESTTGIAEGSSVTFTVYAHNVTPGSLLYYYTSGNADITGSNTGSVVMNGVSNTITLTTASTVPGNQTRNFALVLSGSNLGAPIATSNTISVADLALTSITATGGIVSLSGGYKIHQFTTSGNLIITGASPLTQMEYLAIAGGGGGGSAAGRSEQFGYGGAGGGAGGVLIGNLSAATTGNITVVIGAGGAGGTANPNFYGNAGSLGGNSVLNLNLVAVGGGGGGGGLTATNLAGGSGGGGSKFQTEGANVIGQGNPGGLHIGFGTRSGAGGGGGYSSRGGSAFYWPEGQDSGGYAGIGGNGLTSSISGANIQYAGGGGGGYTQPNTFQANVGVFGGGNGAPGSPTAGGAGNVNTGGGGGGGAGFFAPVGIQGLGGAGGSGVVIIRYPWQPLPFYTSVTANAFAVTAGGNAFFVINTTFANGSVLFYDTVGNVTSSNFVNGNTGSFVVTGNATVLRLETISNIPTDEERTFQLRIREDSATGNIVLVSGDVTTYDSNISIYIQATGGTLISANGYRTHFFTTSNTFVVTDPGKLKSIEYMMVAGGGAGGTNRVGGGGGAGGILFGSSPVVANTYVVSIGGGGASVSTPAPPAAEFKVGGNGGNSSIIGATIIGPGVFAVGGGGGAGDISPGIAKAGGSGGGGPAAGGAGYGFPGIIGSTMQGYPGGGGGGSDAARGGGGAGGSAPTVNGGIGIASPLSSTIPSSYGTGGPASGRWFAGGGGAFPAGIGTAGGGGFASPSTSSPIGGAGNVNTGGGGAGATIGTSSPSEGRAGSGGSGIVIIRYPYI